MSIAYPLFVFEKDDKSMRLIEEEGRILSWHEAIDIENDEYVFWDAYGGGVSIRIAKNKVTSVTSCAPAFPIRDAFTSYMKVLDLPETEMDGTPVQVWQRIQEASERRRNKQGFFSRLFSR